MLCVDLEVYSINWKNVMQQIKYVLEPENYIL